MNTNLCLGYSSYKSATCQWLGKAAESGSGAEVCASVWKLQMRLLSPRLGPAQLWWLDSFEEGSSAWSISSYFIFLSVT